MLVDVVLWFTITSDFLRPVFWFFGSCEITEAVLRGFPNWPEDVSSLRDGFLQSHEDDAWVGGGGIQKSVKESLSLVSNMAMVKILLQTPPWTMANSVIVLLCKIMKKNMDPIYFYWLEDDPIRGERSILSWLGRILTVLLYLKASFSKVNDC